MNRIKHFANFLEALKPSQFRRFVQAFNKERYTDIFKKYEGDRNHYRIYLPLKGEKLDMNVGPEKELTEYLAVAGYEVLDYVKGTCRFKDAKNPSKIGQVLTKLGAKDNEAKRLMKAFVEDDNRKAGSKDQLMVVISRHPYDIAGADTDRDWTNCMTMAHGTSERVTKKHDEVERLRRELRQVKQEWQTLEQEIDERKIGKNFVPSIDKEERLKELQSKDDEINAKINDLISEIEDRTETGANAKYLLYDVKEGSLVSYLVRKDDLDIKNPISVLNIKPYIREAEDDKEVDKDDFVLVSDTEMYGKKVPTFKSTVDTWLDEVNGAKYGRFTLNPVLYADSDETYYRLDPSQLSGKINTVAGIERFIRKEGLEEEFEDQVKHIERILDAVRGKDGYEKVLTAAGKYISKVREYPGIRATYMQCVMSDQDLNEDLFWSVVAAEKNKLGKSALVFYWEIRKYLYGDPNQKVIFEIINRRPEVIPFLKEIAGIYFFRNRLGLAGNMKMWYVELDETFFFGVEDQNEDDRAYVSELDDVHMLLFIHVRLDHEDSESGLLQKIFDYEHFENTSVLDYVPAPSSYSYGSTAYVGKIDPEKAESIANAFDEKVVDVDEEALGPDGEVNPYEKREEPVMKEKKKKEKKKKEKKNESRISGFDDFRI
jgi:hypothetical protein